MRTAAREQFAACWNAALDAARESEFEGMVSLSDIGRLRID
jgi:hypothetical protein